MIAALVIRRRRTGFSEFITGLRADLLGMKRLQDLVATATDSEFLSRVTRWNCWQGTETRRLIITGGLYNLRLRASHDVRPGA